MSIVATYPDNTTQGRFKRYQRKTKDDLTRALIKAEDRQAELQIKRDELYTKLDRQTQLANSLASELERLKRTPKSHRPTDCLTPWRTPCNCPACGGDNHG